MASNRRDYSVRDHTGDVWNVEPLPTFSQAYDFKNAIKGQLNRDLTLSITSTPRPDKIVMAVKAKPIDTRQANLFADWGF